MMGFSKQQNSRYNTSRFLKACQIETSNIMKSFGYPSVINYNSKSIYYFLLFLYFS